MTSPQSSGKNGTVASFLSSTSRERGASQTSVFPLHLYALYVWFHPCCCLHNLPSWLRSTATHTRPARAPSKPPSRAHTTMLTLMHTSTRRVMYTLTVHITQVSLNRRGGWVVPKSARGALRSLAGAHAGRSLVPVQRSAHEMSETLARVPLQTATFLAPREPPLL